jgi:hypothetical protein
MGYHEHVDSQIQVRGVRRVVTKSGSTRFVLEDAEGNEYTTFREGIGEAAESYEGRPAVITYHEEQRGNYRNVYLDAINPAPDEAEETSSATPAAGEADEVGWRTAIEASPWLLGSSEPDREVPPEEFFDKLKPFKELVSEDIKEGDEEPHPTDED